MEDSLCLTSSRVKYCRNKTNKQFLLRQVKHIADKNKPKEKEQI